MKILEFPVSAFTQTVQDHVTSLSDYYSIHKNITGSAVLNACGFVLSDLYNLRVTDTWIVRSNLWTMVSMNSGMGKSVVMRNVYAPVVRKQAELFDKTRKNNALAIEWQDLLKTLKIKTIGDYIGENTELSDWLKSHGLNVTPPKKTVMPNLYCADFTVEKLGQMLYDNDEHPILIKADEIFGFFKMLNKYNQGRGNDEENILKLWEYDPYKVDRIKDGGDYIVKCPIVSLFGATQKELLYKIYTDDRKINGNAFRFLFCSDPSKPKMKKLAGNYSFDDKLKGFMDHHLQMFDGEKKDRDLFLEPGCREFVDEWRFTCEAKYVTVRHTDERTFLSMMGKMDFYIYRIAIILNRLCDFYGDKSENVRICDLKNAGMICEYYIEELLTVLESTDLSYHFFLKDDKEVEFYENTLQPQFMYHDFVKGAEHFLKINRRQSEKLFQKWQVDGLIKRSPKGAMYKCH